MVAQMFKVTFSCGPTDFLLLIKHSYGTHCVLGSAVRTSQVLTPLRAASAVRLWSLCPAAGLTYQVRHIEFQILILSRRSGVTVGKWLGGPLHSFLHL